MDCGKITAVVASFQNAPTYQLRERIRYWLSSYLHDVAPGIKIHANPAGEWDIGGFDADTGLTGRKIVVDNYGPRVPIGGGAFSGKDPSKVDRSAAYMARRIAVDYLRSHDATETKVYLAYAIGHPEPVQATVYIDDVPQEITGYDLTPEGIVTLLDLRTPKYSDTAGWGHFGREDFAWE